MFHEDAFPAGTNIFTVVNQQTRTAIGQFVCETLRPPLELRIIKRIYFNNNSWGEDGDVKAIAYRIWNPKTFICKGWNKEEYIAYGLASLENRK